MREKELLTLLDQYESDETGQFLVHIGRHTHIIDTPIYRHISVLFNECSLSRSLSCQDPNYRTRLKSLQPLSFRERSPLVMHIYVLLT